MEFHNKSSKELDRTTLMFQNFIQSHDIAKAKTQENFNDMILGKALKEIKIYRLTLSVF